MLCQRGRFAEHPYNSCQQGLPGLVSAVMSLFDRFTARPQHRWKGLEPPPLSVFTLIDDLRWHAALYRQDDLSSREAITFLALRVVQRVAYNVGWIWGHQR